MDMSDLPLFGTNVDKSQVPPIHQKRIVAFVNTFIYKTTAFLDQFLAQCENKFLELEVKILRVDTQLKLLEAKLDSIPDLENTIVINPIVQVTTNHISKVEEANRDTVDQQVYELEQVKEMTAGTNPETCTEPGVKAKDDYRYKKYFNMVKFGVPAAAIKMKMQAEGVNPYMLDNPDLILVDGVIEPVVEESDSESN